MSNRFIILPNRRLGEYGLYTRGEPSSPGEEFPRAARLLLNHFDGERDRDRVSDHSVTARQLVAHVGRAEMLAINFCRSRGAAPRSVHRLDGSARPRGIER